MRVVEDLGRQVTWEVWREGPEGKRQLVAAHMSAGTSKGLLRECEADARMLTMFSFYRVRATTYRERVEET